MAPTTPLPEGTVTFLFTDIEGSTRLLQHLGAGYAAVREEHRRLLRAAFQVGEGQELGTEGDSFFVVFPTAPGALAAAVAAQRALAARPWPEGFPVRVRMGLHTGTPTLTLGEYVGLDVHRAARISAAGHGGQILLSQSTRSLVEHDLPPGTSLRDLGAHRLKDLQHPEQLSQIVVAGLPIDFPPLRSLEAVAHNLPIQLTRFIGREEEMAAVRRLLSASRLVTLTGTGGCGKTRLALQVAAERVEEAVDGVWLVELAALADAALVPQVVASVLGVREEPGRSLTETLSDFLRAKRLLLVLDNCEHLVEACAQLVVGLLRVCADLRVLTTSREALRVAGEVAWRVPSLSVPDPQDLPPPGAGLVAALTRYEAARLFVDRTRLSQPRFAVTSENARTVAQVCRRLDGIPLAIELAAARVKMLSVEQIAERLDDRFRLLTGGSRTALPRQQTLRAAIDWSYDLLSEAERVLLRRLSVFAGGFTLEAAEALCASVDSSPAPGVGEGAAGAERDGGERSEGVAADEILDLLTRLVDRSLVLVEDRGSEVWYRLLETIRQYSAEKLQDSAEGSALRARHRDWFLALAEEGDRQLLGPDQGVWLDRLEREHDNLRAGLGWSLESREIEPGLRMVGALWRFWEVRGHLMEGRGWLERALSAESGRVPAPTEGMAALRAKALTGAGTMAWCQGDYEQAVAFHEGALALYQELADEYGIALSLNNLGAQAIHQADFERARALLGESLSRSRSLEDPELIARSAANLGAVACYTGDYGAARSHYEESLALRRQMGDQRSIAGLVHDLGEVAQFEGDSERASTLHRESLVLFHELGDQRGIAACLEGLAKAFAAQGQAERAARLFAAAETLREAVGLLLSTREEQADRDHYLAAVRTGLGDEAFATAWAQGSVMTPAQAIARAFEELASA